MIGDLWFRLRWRWHVRRSPVDRLAENPRDGAAIQNLIKSMGLCREHTKVMPHHRCNESNEWLDAFEARMR